MEYVTDLWYAQQNQFNDKGEIVGASDVLQVETEEHLFDVPNGDFTTENPSLQLLAYIGERPTTIEGYSGGAVVPVVRNVNGASIAQLAFENGKSILEEAVWGPEI